MKFSKSVTLDQELINDIKKEAKERDLTFSEVLEQRAERKKLTIEEIQKRINLKIQDIKILSAQKSIILENENKKILDQQKRIKELKEKLGEKTKDFLDIHKKLSKDQRKKIKEIESLKELNSYAQLILDQNKNVTLKEIILYKDLLGSITSKV